MGPSGQLAAVRVATKAPGLDALSGDVPSTSDGSVANMHTPPASRVPPPRSTSRPLLVLLALLAACASFSADAAEDPARECIAGAARAFGVDETVLSLLREVEGGWPGAEVRNTNGSHDLGVMQVNTIHLRYFAQFGVTREDLRDSACINVYAGTHLYARHLQETGGDVPRAMAAYHSKTPRFAARYLERIQAVIARRLRTMAAAPATAPNGLVIAGVSPAK